KLVEHQYEVILVPADDIDEAFTLIRQAMQEITERFPDASLIADYTGGTKTMTAALVTAVLETTGVELQLVTGARADLSSVADSTEYVISASVDSIRLERSMQPYINAWRRHAYDEAEQGLANVFVPRDPNLRSRLNLVRSLSRAFASWDRFEHQGAQKGLETYRQRIGASYSRYLNALKIMTDENQPGSEALRLYDLWLNACRRSTQGRYDDAVARVYRLIEWTAQWQLRLHTGINTSDVDMSRLPSSIELSKDPQGRHQAGLFKSWQMIEQMFEGPCANFIQANGEILRTHIKLRNDSILAHGYTPIDAASWRRIEDWLKQAFIPMLEDLVRIDGGIKFDLAALQLPTEPLQ
ncbi:MAG: TIGR02710 family CRISPR-associated CARF protein, partial [Mariprofundaceae bacterium]|nr:TIGR02710 family CRISPR-associated CARF protein [Mariprofundaceae bacterium]